MEHSDITRLANILGSQTKAARVLGVTQEHVSRMVNGSREVPQYVAIIADFLEQTPRANWPVSVLVKVEK